MYIQVHSASSLCFGYEGGVDDFWIKLFSTVRGNRGSVVDPGQGCYDPFTPQVD